MPIFPREVWKKQHEGGVLFGEDPEIMGWLFEKEKVEGEKMLEITDVRVDGFSVISRG